MKKKIFIPLILFSLFFGFACSPTSEHQTENQDSISSILKLNDTTKMKSFLGKSLLDIIAKPDSAIMFAIDSKQRDTLNGFMSFKVIKSKKVDFLKANNFLLDSANYQFDSVLKKCSFRPTIGLVYYKNNKVAKIGIATDCGIIKFQMDTLILSEDCDNAILKYKNFYFQIFNDSIK